MLYKHPVVLRGFGWDATDCLGAIINGTNGELYDEPDLEFGGDINVYWDSRYLPYFGLELEDWAALVSLWPQYPPSGALAAV